jgi:membrane fusion protein, multidrug efflux system
VAQTRNGLRRRSIPVAVACLAILAAAGWLYLSGSEETDRGGRKVSQASAESRPGVPVSVAVARRADVPIHLTGLGTVQAQFTVAVHTQVDGKLVDVFFNEGQRVRRGDVLAKIDPRLYQAALDQAKAKKAMDEAALVAAQKDLVRFETLVLKNVESQQNLDLQQAKVDQLKASIDADAAAIETAQTNFDYTNIVAPHDGRMGMRLVDPGNIVHAGDQGAIAILTQTQPAMVMFTLPAHTLDDVRRAMTRGAVEVAAYDRDNVRQLSIGRLSVVDNLIDQATASYRLKAKFANEDETLWPGEFVNARLLLETLSAVTVIPPAAVQRGPNGLFAWVVKADNTVEARPIRIGATTAEEVVVTSGVGEGERVVTGGQYKLHTNAPVAITQPPPIAADGDKT